jgi:hypothetical protein
MSGKVIWSRELQKRNGGTWPEVDRALLGLAGGKEACHNAYDVKAA